jgi:hypothetical protein
MALTFEIDAVSEDATNTALTISATPYRLREVDLTPPDLDARYASSVDTEGELPVAVRHHNRHIMLTLMITGADVATNAAFETAMGDLVKKLMKLHREGGTLKMTTPAGTTAVADVLTVNTKPTLDQLWPVRRVGTVQIDFECRPYFRGASSQLSDHVETTSPVLVFTEAGAGVTGDVPALGRLMLDEDQASQDQGWVTWGLQSRYYDSAASAALFYEAEGRTVQGGATAVAGPTGASGAGSNVVRLTSMAASPSSMLSTQATAAGAHLSHIGTFRVYARVQTAAANTAVTNIALEWGTGDLLRPQFNDTTQIPVAWGGSWRLVDLGLVTIPKVVTGTQRWEGRVIVWGASTGGQIDLDYLFLVPSDEGSGIVSAIQTPNSPTTFTVRDEFDQTAGALNAKTLPVGGAWATSGDATDFAVVAGSSHFCQRSVTGGTARWAIAGSTTLTNCIVETAMTKDAAATTAEGGGYGGVIARWTDSSNYLRLVATLPASGTSATATLTKVVGGASTDLASWGSLAAVRLRLIVLASGAWYAYADDGSGAISLLGRGSDSSLATGGTLATGKLGIYHLGTATP